jgi:hypothetical protein
VAQSPCPEDINWIRYPVHSHYHIISIDICKSNVNIEALKECLDRAPRGLTGTLWESVSFPVLPVSHQLPDTSILP